LPTTSATRFSARAALGAKTNTSGINANAIAISLRIRGMTSPIQAETREVETLLHRGCAERHVNGREGQE
jgi:hypothetical protein